MNIMAISFMASNGLVCLSIDGKKYSYWVDTAHYPAIKAFYNRGKRGKALDIIKKKGAIVEGETHGAT